MSIKTTKIVDVESGFASIRVGAMIDKNDFTSDHYDTIMSHKTRINNNVANAMEGKSPSERLKLMIKIKGMNAGRIEKK